MSQAELALSCQSVMFPDDNYALMRVLKNKLDFFPLSSAKVLIIIKMIPNYFCSSSRLSFSCSSKTLNVYYLYQGENIYVKTPLINLMKLPSETWRYNVDL